MSTSHGHQATTHDAPDSPDSWHAHTAAEPRPQVAHTSEVPSHRVIAMGTLGFLIIVVAVVATWEYFKSYTTELRQQREEQVDFAGPALAERAQLLGQLRDGTPGFVGPGGVIQIPAAQASKRVMERYSQK